MTPPNLLPCSADGGDWNAYEKELHRVFMEEIARAGLYLRGQRVSCRRIPKTAGHWDSSWGTGNIYRCLEGPKRDIFHDNQPFTGLYSENMVVKFRLVDQGCFSELVFDPFRPFCRNQSLAGLQRGHMVKRRTPSQRRQPCFLDAPRPERDS